MCCLIIPILIGEDVFEPRWNKLKVLGLKLRLHLHQATTFSWSAHHSPWSAAHYVLFAKRSQAAHPQPVCSWQQLAGCTPLTIHAYSAPEGCATGDAGRYDLTRWRLHPGLSRHVFFRVNKIRVGGGGDMEMTASVLSDENIKTDTNPPAVMQPHSGMLLSKNKQQTIVTLNCMDPSLKGWWEEAARHERVNASGPHIPSTHNRPEQSIMTESRSVFAWSIRKFLEWMRGSKPWLGCLIWVYIYVKAHQTILKMGYFTGCK